jgi:hypothetical protein
MYTPYENQANCEIRKVGEQHGLPVYGVYGLTKLIGPCQLMMYGGPMPTRPPGSIDYGAIPDDCLSYSIESPPASVHCSRGFERVESGATPYVFNSLASLNTPSSPKYHGGY